MFIATMASVRILHLWEISLEDVVREMQQRYSSLVDISPDAITVHRDNKVVFVNQAALTLFGASSADQLLGRSPFEFLHPSYHATMSKRIAYMYAGHSVSLVESQIVRLDGTTAFVEIAAAPFKEQGTTAIQVVLRNITERKKAEEILKRDKVALEALIAERTRELLQANKDLEQAQRMADIGRLSATIAHELRTPLAGIKAAAFNIQKKINSQTIDKHLLTINKKVLESDQIIQNLLNFTRIKAVEYAPVQCAEILRECTSAIAARYASWKIRLEEDDQYNEDVTIDADATQLRMLFCNILDNAYQSCHGGGSGMIRVSIILPDLPRVLGAPTARAERAACTESPGVGGGH
jgi:PAS domain S-box-containing protein